MSPDSAIVEDVDATAMLFGRAMAKAADARRREIRQEETLLAYFAAEWDDWTYGPSKWKIPRPDDWERTIVNFMAAGLAMSDIEHFIPIAMKSKARPDGTWRYFCGCCWNEITDRQEMARRLIEDGKV